MSNSLFNLDLSKSYELYKSSLDKYMSLDGFIYYKIINKLKVLDFSIITLPVEMLDYFESLTYLEDEFGTLIRISNPITFSFSSEIPEWYLKTVSVIVHDVDLEGIGDYVRLN